MTMLAALALTILGALWAAETVVLLLLARGLLRTEGTTPADPAR